ncbi:MAG: M48 family metallopeptidase [Coleofasciculus sp. S288]|nr:M48 family metallopeptidase [Coleofasciculus sp. S288]
MEIIKLEGLNPLEYEHPLDKKALNTLEKTPGLDFLVNKFYNLGLSKLLQLELVGNSIKITPSSLPNVYEILEDTCEILNLKTVPELYVRYGDTFGVQSNNFQGTTVGVDHPLIIISTECIDSFSRQELSFVLGCEIGRIKSQHIFYKQIAVLLPIVSELITGAVAVDFTKPVTSGIGLALLQWSRWSEFTVDRAGLLACQNLTVAMTVMAKMAGLPGRYFESFNIDDFVTQVREYEGFGDTSYAKFLKISNLAFKNQAFVISRASELLKWTDSGEYQAVLERQTKIKPLLPASFCRHCGFKLESFSTFCPNCGQRISA